VSRRLVWSRAAAAALALAVLALAPQPALRLGAAEVVAPGIELFRIHQPDLVNPPGPVTLQVLRLDPRRVRLACALAQDQMLGSETVADMARRHKAIAAINAGFFLPNGEPAGLMKVGGVLVSDTRLQRGAVAILPAAAGAPVALVFDQVSVSLELAIQTRAGSSAMRVDGVDTVRRPGEIVWFTERFNLHTDTTDTGTEWVLRGPPMVVTERRDSAMRTLIPGDGAVLSFGGIAPGAPLSHLNAGDSVRPSATYTTALGTAPSAWHAAPDAVGGAGLLVSRGQLVKDWAVEKLRVGFATERHPRTMIGTDGGGRIWLVTVDGRRPQVSLGMSFAELQDVARGLGLVDALNLDGGGSTTMVVKGAVVNHPSDAGGPRRVSDAILVFPASR